MFPLTPAHFMHPGIIQQPTSNTQLPMIAIGSALGCSMLDVGCWMFPPFELALFQQVQHLPVELVAAKVLVLDVGALAVEHTKGAVQIPERPAPTRFLP